mgnify:CR=1 FL=1
MTSSALYDYFGSLLTPLQIKGPMMAFLLLIVIALVIALPAGWIIVGNLLKQFANRIDLSAGVFIAIAAGALIIALITVTFQAVKASLVNPAAALKME